MAKNKNGKQKQPVLEEVPEELEEGEEYYDYSAEEEEDDFPGLAGGGMGDMLGHDEWGPGGGAPNDSWGIPKQAVNSQWTNTIPTPAQMAAGKGGQKMENKKAKGGNAGGWDAYTAEAWNTGGATGGGWNSTTNANGWGMPTEEKRWDTAPQPAQQAKPTQGHWTTWSEEAKRLPKGHDVRSAYQHQGAPEQPKGGKQQQKQHNEKGKKKNKQNGNEPSAADLWAAAGAGGAAGDRWGDSGGWGATAAGGWGVMAADGRGPAVADDWGPPAADDWGAGAGGGSWGTTLGAGDWGMPQQEGKGKGKGKKGGGGGGSDWGMRG
ncbi:hypothetical protein FB45DRAFT_1054823, partial [Roridomyces roridus]